MLIRYPLCASLIVADQPSEGGTPWPPWASQIYHIAPSLIITISYAERKIFKDNFFISFIQTSDTFFETSLFLIIFIRWKFSNTRFILKINVLIKGYNSKNEINFITCSSNISFQRKAKSFQFNTYLVHAEARNFGWKICKTHGDVGFPSSLNNASNIIMDSLNLELINYGDLFGVLSVFIPKTQCFLQKNVKKSGWSLSFKRPTN